MCDIDSKYKDSDECTEADTPCSSSKSFYSDTSNADFSSRKKSVSFNSDVQVFLIPSRKDALSYVLSQCWKNVMGTQNLDKIKTRIQKKTKSVRFYKIVTLFPVPNRDDLKSIAKDLWYESEEIVLMEREAQDL